jgi:transposase InsO family protein
MDTMFFKNIGVEREGKKRKKKKTSDTAPKKPIGLTIVCGLDLFSRYAFAYCIFGEIGISSLQAKDALEKFMKEIKTLGYSIETLYTDSGGEFKQSFKSFVDKEGIPLIMSSPNDPFKNRNIERFNRTLRGLIEKFILLYGKNIKSRHVDLIVNAYNRTIHRSLIGYTPYSILTDNDKAEELWKHYNELKSFTYDIQDPVVLEEGTFVRVFIRKADVFKKVGKNWSKTIYTVDKYFPETKLYKLKENKDLYRREYLQIVDKKLFDQYNYKPASLIEADDIVLEGEKRVRRKKVIKDV